MGFNSGFKGLKERRAMAGEFTFSYSLSDAAPTVQETEMKFIIRSNTA